MINTRLRTSHLLFTVAMVSLNAGALRAQETVGAASATTPGPTTGDTSNSDKILTEIVVTGTSLRKVEPAGAEAVGVSAEQVAATGATDANQVLATLPQLGSFGTFTNPVGGGGAQLTVARVDIRNLPQTTGGGSPTLILLDGHRLVGAGVQQTAPDPVIVPPALIERVDVLTDGGSAIYGADAIGGVVNFITKHDFDGIDAGVRQSFASDYRKTDVNFTAGKSWGTGNAYVGYNYSTHDPLYGYERDYVRQIDYTTGLPTGQYCNPGNVTANGALYAITGGGSALTPGTGNVCDLSRAQEIVPEEKRSSVMAGLFQKLSDTLEFDLKGYYTSRNDLFDSGPLQGSASVAPGNPNYISTGDANAAATQSVLFNFTPVVGSVADTTTQFSTWGVTPTLTWKMPADWQMRVYYNYGESDTIVHQPLVNSTVLQTDAAAGTINPYNIASSNPAALGSVLDYEQYGRGKDTMKNAKATFDGPVVELPGGTLRVAVGGEYIGETYQGIFDPGNTKEATATEALLPASRHVEAGFVEANIPVISEDNHVPLINSFTVSAAERYDRYSDFGGNWAPNLGASLKPISWIKLRARWNRSFQAPSLAQLATATASPVIYPPFIASYPFLHNPAVPYQPGQVLVNVGGTITPLEPELSRDYDAGIDISPPIVPGLNLHLSYYNINYTGQIGIPPSYLPSDYWPYFSSLFMMNPSLAQVQSFLSSHGVSPALVANATAQINALSAGNPNSIYVVEDGRQRNLGVSKVNGFDMGLDYTHSTAFGSVFGSFNGSFLNHAINAADGVDYTPDQAGVNYPAFESVAIAGVTVGTPFRGQLTWNHMSGFALSPTAALNQTRAKPFDTVDLNAQYVITGHGPGPVTLSMTINNLFNANPPIYNGQYPLYSSYGYTAQTLGRVLQLGVEVKL